MPVLRRHKPARRNLTQASLDHASGPQQQHSLTRYGRCGADRRFGERDQQQCQQADHEAFQISHRQKSPVGRMSDDWPRSECDRSADQSVKLNAGIVQHLSLHGIWSLQAGQTGRRCDDRIATVKPEVSMPVIRQPLADAGDERSGLRRPTANGKHAIGTVDRDVRLPGGRPLCKSHRDQAAGTPDGHPIQLERARNRFCVWTDNKQRPASQLERVHAANAAHRSGQFDRRNTTAEPAVRKAEFTRQRIGGIQCLPAQESLMPDSGHLAGDRFRSVVVLRVADGHCPLRHATSHVQ